MKKPNNILLKTTACAMAGLLCSQVMVASADPRSDKVPELSIIEYDTIQLEALHDVHKHQEVIDEAVAPGLFHTGLTQGSHCSSCGEVLKAQEEVPAVALTRNLSYGCYGDDVLEMQQSLYDLGYLAAVPDGSFGWYTYEAVVAFQEANGLEYPDGIFGNWSLNKMRELVGTGSAHTPNSSQGQTQDSSDHSTSDNLYNISADDVYSVQEQLSNLGYLTSEFSGYFGELTKEALYKFQLYNGLPMTGSIDDATLALINRGTGSAYRYLYYGCSGTDVENLQKALIHSGYLEGNADGSFGSMTESAVASLQADLGIDDQDGVFGGFFIGGFLNNGVTANHTVRLNDNQANANQNTQANSTVLSYGSAGDEVYNLQQALWDLGFLYAAPDGSFGYMTQTALKAYQWYNGFRVNGVADDSLLSQLYNDDSMGFRYLYYDSYGYDVYLLEEALSGMGYFDEIPDYYFDWTTEDALINFQTKNGIENPDGIFGIYSLNLLVNDPILNAEDESNTQEDGRNGVSDEDIERIDEAYHEIIASNEALGQQIVDYAMQWVGVTPYVDAYERYDEEGNFYNSLVYGTDCSGFTNLIYEAFGIYVPAGSSEYQYDVGVAINEEDLLPGDIIVYRYGGHVAIYAGDDMIVHCSTPESGTVYANMWYDEPTAYIRVVF